MRFLPLFLAFVACVIFHPVFSQATLVQDILPGSGAGVPAKIAFGSGADNRLVVLGNSTYFSADDGTHGLELWRSDLSGTQMVKDIQPGAVGSTPLRLLVMNNALYFFANDGVHGDELWRSDGTEAGTVLVKDINQGANSSIRRDYVIQTKDWVVKDNTLYFAADVGSNYSQLWKSDGTEAGTVLVKNVCTSCSANSFGVSYFIVFNNLVWFTVGTNLYKSDGTTAGTKEAINSSSINGGFLSNLTVSNNKIFMRGGDPFSNKFMVTDGTEAGTQVLSTFAFYGAPRQFTAAGSKLFFFANDQAWVSDGTVAGTVELSNKYADNGADPINTMYAWKGSVWYAAQGANDKRYLYKSTGDGTGVAVVALLNDDSGTPPPNYIAYASDDNYLYFTGLKVASTPPGFIGRIAATDNAFAQVQVSDYVVKDMVLNNNNLYFRGDNSATGQELWRLFVAPAEANIAPISSTVCTGAGVSISAQVSPDGAGGTYSWNFGAGATPPTAQGIGSHTVTYSSTGSKTVRLIATGSFGNDTSTVAIVVEPATTAQFTTVQTGLSFQFNSAGSVATTYTWNFGDGGSSSLPNPVHIFAGTGTYTVTLTTDGPCGTAVQTKNIIITSGTDELALSKMLLVAPNPASDHISISSKSGSWVGGNYRVIISDLQGRIVHESNGFLEQRIDLSKLSVGTYTVAVFSGVELVGKQLFVVAR
jgi:ELWxxDGT repeat protein